MTTPVEFMPSDPADMPWDQHQAWERDWWGDCTNTFSEENKQISYAHRMGLEIVPTNDGRWPVFDLQGKSILDIGGGPTSILLKCINRGPCLVADPCPYPSWVQRRYSEAGIQANQLAGEQLSPDLLAASGFDEIWIYNVLQHTLNPEKIAANARGIATTIRVFEWIDTPPAIGHPHTLTQAKLDMWFGTTGTVEHMNENGCVGPAWYATARSAATPPVGELPTASESITMEGQVAAALLEGVDPDQAAASAERILALVREAKR